MFSPSKWQSKPKFCEIYLWTCPKNDQKWSEIGQTQKLSVFVSRQSLLFLGPYNWTWNLVRYGRRNNSLLGKFEKGLINGRCKCSSYLTKMKMVIDFLTYSKGYLSNPLERWRLCQILFFELDTSNFLISLNCFSFSKIGKRWY